jgi:hypothetical protein
LFWLRKYSAISIYHYYFMVILIPISMPLSPRPVLAVPKEEKTNNSKAEVGHPTECIAVQRYR